MAIKTKSIEFAWPNLSAAADATYTAFGLKTIHFPETSITIRSAYLEVSWQDEALTIGASIAATRVRYTVQGAVTNEYADLNVIAHTTKNMASIFSPIDITTYFAANRGTGISSTINVEFFQDRNTGTGLGVRNMSCKLYVTYDYEALSTTHINTARIPLDSSIVNNASTLTEIGTSQIPILTGVGGFFQGMTGLVIRDYWFEIEANELNGNVVTDWTLGVSLDAEVATNFNAQKSPLPCDRFCRWIWSRAASIPTTTVTHQFKMATSLVRCHHAVVTLHVTYEWTPGTSTECVNSILIPFSMTNTLGISATQVARSSRSITINEPGTVTLLHSATRIGWNENVTVGTVNMRIGVQLYRAYTTGTGNNYAGMSVIQRRFDSGAIGGAGITFARGRISLDVETHSSAALPRKGTNVSGVHILNYRSSISSQGFGSHLHTTFWAIIPFTHAGNLAIVSTSVAPTVAQSVHYLEDVSYIIRHDVPIGTNGMTLEQEVKTGEFDGTGFRETHISVYRANAARGHTTTYIEDNNAFKRHPAQPDVNSLAFETPRLYRFNSLGAIAVGVVGMATYRSVTHPVTGTVSGYTGDGTGITINLHDTISGKVVSSAVTTAGGQFSIPWYDNVTSVYTTAVQSTKAGRSTSSMAT